VAQVERSGASLETSPDGASVGMEGLYARKSSGLVRELGIKDAFSINVGAINLAFIPMLALITPTLFPQSDLTIPLIAGAAIGVLLAMVYAQLLAALPRSGGDYVYASRIFHPTVGAAVGGAVFLALLIAGSPIFVFIAQSTLPFFLRAVGSALGSNGIANLADHLGGRNTQFAVALVILLGTFALAAARTHFVTRIVFWWTFGLAALALLSFVLLFITHDNAHFQASFNHYAHHPGSYQAVIAAAHHAGLATGVKGSAVISAIPFGVLVYLGLTYSVYPGGEVRRPGRTQLLAGVLATLGTLTLGLVYWLTLRHTVGLSFLQSAGWLSSNHADAYAKATSVDAFAPTYGLLLAGDPITKLLMGFGILLGLMGAGLAYLITVSRLLFALSFDRLLPTWITDVNARTHAPTKATAVAVLGMTLFVALSIYTNAFTAFRNIILVFEVLFTLSSIAAVILPYRGREFYRASPKLFGTFMGVPTISILGAVSTVVNGLMVYFAASKTQISGGYDTASILTLIGVGTVGLFAYAASRYGLSRRGIDLSLAMRELPPE
jgi:amino acid transporter